MCQPGAAVQCAVDGWRAVCMTMRPVGLGLGTLETHSVASGSVPLASPGTRGTHVTGGIFDTFFAHVTRTRHTWTKARPVEFCQKPNARPEPDMGQP